MPDMLRVVSGDSLKQQAADSALAHVSSGMVVGLGTGSTAALFIAALGRRLADGTLSGIRGIPTSETSRRQADEAGIPLATFHEAGRCDVTVDGADEIDAQLNLIKGLGGALLREKIVAQNSDRLIIIADEAKLVDRLGRRCPLPVEVVSFGMECLPTFFRSLGGEPALRMKDGRPYTSDGGNHIFDVRFDSIADAAELEITLLRRAGIVQTGLFLELAHEAIVATSRGIKRLVRS